MTVTQEPALTTPAPGARPRRSVAGRVAGVVAGVALASAAVWVQTTTMSFEQRTSSLTTKGQIGQIVETNRFSVKVNSVAAAHAVDTADYSGKVTKVPTDALFLVVNVTATSPREPMRLNSQTPPIVLAADGRQYQPTDKVNESLTLFSKYLQPGMWSRGDLVYEVPPDAVPGARFVFIPPNSYIVDSYAPEAEVDLGLTPEAARRLISKADDYHPLVTKTS
ncbi:hypothetical protein Pth03_59150 [Planotetraspora thailandica]|uniref:DUF4352 domain-containing protein n=1 Tax=Planotetraspora thailandica TaxID=487172 RepID=A0A8J3V9P5_9ACTN|nr:DUF4352 domain-containing protein [Planotetraspora thailandica]GII57526.1 hypothetical protein Pth03_59150 [Planotetraspora thailandica]